ncbi:MAG: isoprenylcysteine carboxylmethyltransferase family protein [Hydrogenophaga sp.]|nr:isoprenylcysteine carboxylmethyltransferase family protein [Hydrogenophaga sp.]
MRWLELKVPPPAVALLLAAAMWWAAPQVPALDGLPTWRAGLALVLVVAGGSVDMAGLWAFHRQRTTVNPLRPANASALVTGGVYRITRNPMYVGMACFLLAWAVWLGTLAAFLGPVALVAYLTRFQIQPEERVLTQLFGTAYTDYTQRVRRWL